MLATNQIYIRRLERDDLERTHVWVNQAEIFTIMGIFGPRSKTEQQRWYDAVCDSRTNLIFALCLVDGDEHIGNVSIFDIDYLNRNAGLTIFIPDTRHRGKGYGTDAVRLLCNYAFSYLNLEKLTAKTDNSIAAHVYEALNFKLEGVLRKHTFRDGCYVDKHVYGLLRAEYVEPR